MSKRRQKIDPTKSTEDLTLVEDLGSWPPVDSEPALSNATEGLRDATERRMRMQEPVVQPGPTQPRIWGMSPRKQRFSALEQRYEGNPIPLSKNFSPEEMPLVRDRVRSFEVGAQLRQHWEEPDEDFERRRAFALERLVGRSGEMAVYPDPPLPKIAEPGSAATVHSFDTWRQEGEGEDVDSNGDPRRRGFMEPIEKYNQKVKDNDKRRREVFKEDEEAGRLDAGRRASAPGTEASSTVNEGLEESFGDAQEEGVAARPDPGLQVDGSSDSESEQVQSAEEYFDSLIKDAAACGSAPPSDDNGPQQ